MPADDIVRVYATDGVSQWAAIASAVATFLTALGTFWVAKVTGKTASSASESAAQAEKGVAQVRVIANAWDNAQEQPDVPPGDRDPSAGSADRGPHSEEPSSAGPVSRQEGGSEANVLPFPPGENTLSLKPDLPKLTLADIGRDTGGAILVHLSYGGEFVGDPDRLKWGPDHDDDDTMYDNTVKWWWLKDVLKECKGNEQDRPQALLGVSGTVADRYVVSSLRIEPRWFDTEQDSAFFEVLVQTNGYRPLDYKGLRGRYVEGVRFGNIRQQSFIWVDSQGRIRKGGRGA